MIAPKPLLSRVANSLYWMARYVERAENIARSIDVNLRLTLDQPSYQEDQWGAIVDTTGDGPVFRERYGRPNQDSVVHYLAGETNNPNSIVSCVRAARENARSVREIVSSEVWEQVNELYLLVQRTTGPLATAVLPDYLHRVRIHCHQLQGITDGTMTHNEAWQFIALGRMLERADKTTRLIDVKYFILLPSLSDVGTPVDEIQWAAVLRSASAFEMYRKKYGRIDPADVIEFLLFDNEFPRAARYAVVRADRALHAITGAPIGTFSCASEQRMGMLKSELEFGRGDSIVASGMHEFLDSMQAKMNKIDECIATDFFGASGARVTAAR